MSQFIDVQELKKRAAGRWEMILSALAPELTPALTRIGRHVPCPIHGGKDGFRFFKDDIFVGASVCNTCGYFYNAIALLGRLKGWDFKTCLNEIDALIQSPSKNTTYLSHHLNTGIKTRAWHILSSNDMMKEKQKQQRIESVWSQSISLAETSSALARTYLESRGLVLKDWRILDKTLRFHRGLSYFNKSGIVIDKLPCLLGSINNDSQKITLLRIFLSANGTKADVDAPKKMMPYAKFLSLEAAAIRLITPNSCHDLLCVAEGIETALSIYVATELPVWSCVNAQQLASFVPPKNIKKLLIWADLDQSGTGLKVAEKLKQRMMKQHIKTIILLPPYELINQQKGIDWNDVLIKEGKIFFNTLLQLSR
ncbi:toprim domain-containing protein [Thorsellia kenyensis]|uniref:Toprim domain-containing protein n=1 Tax=Thorsellia kenyensis TaxID=1549888 RepID=A0ABV6CD90_9GAMM